MPDTDPTPSLRARADAWGLQTRYRDAFEEWREAPNDSVEAILAAMRANGDGPPADDQVLFVRPGRETRVRDASELTLEDGTLLHLHAGDSLPTDLPLGYHSLTGLVDGRRRTVIRSPDGCRLPDQPTWGWSAQLYAARSTRSWGMGDLGDLRDLGRWSAGELGAGLILINPLHAALPGLPQATSPYYPSSRRFRNPLYLRVEEVPGAESLGADLERLAADGRALNEDRSVDRDALFRIKMQALEELWARFDHDPGFEAFCRQGGESLETYATFCAIADRQKGSWPTWPSSLRHPDGSGVGAFRHDHGRRVDFHRWLQWLIDGQLAAAGAEIALVTDLAVGFDPAGADAWQWQDILADGMSVGAPPDGFNTRGQDWGLPPFDPWRLRAAGYQPFIETVGAALRHTSGLRIDHVMGLFRLFWVPEGTSPADGAYVRYPAADLLDILALESHRAGAYVVGEDLGTADDEIRNALADRHVLSYRLMLFESLPPKDYPRDALAAVATHDLPTIAGLWTGEDLRATTEAGLEPDADNMESLRTRLRELSGVDDDTPVEEMIAATYAALAQSPSWLLTASLDDALAVEERPNVPGTTNEEWPNWSIALPVTLEEVPDRPLPRRLAEILRRD
ncbi:MAG: 4-alpha-glucanotransferase [Actinomycetota bacterium]|nr:4-alpha-glucanotransferase [Actinomycetota bacterium]